MSGKLYRVGTRGYISDVQQILNQYIEHQTKQMTKGKTDPIVKAITRLHEQGFPLLKLNVKSATVLVHSLIKYNVSTFLAYETTELDVEVIASCLFGETVPLSDDVKDIIDDILTTEAIDALQVDINLQLSNCLETNTWNIVDVLDLDTSLSIVISEDLRIREWKQMKGILEPGAGIVDIDLTPVVTYLKNTFNRRYGTFQVASNNQQVEVGVGTVINFRDLITDYLCIRFPFLRKTGQIGPADTMEFKGVTAAAMKVVTKDPEHRQRIASEIIRNTVESYGVCHRLNRLDDTAVHHVYIDDNNRLSITLEGESGSILGNEEQRLKELGEALIRGDYLPVKEREEAERYVQENIF